MFLNLNNSCVNTDPSAAIESSSQWQKKAQRSQELELECENLRETLEQYNAEFSEVKNQGMQESINITHQPIAFLCF